MGTPKRLPADFPGYVVGIVLLVVGGIFLRTPVLNWICGPALIVVSVVVVGRVWDRVVKR